jgi:lysophospholipase L1-like esterase
MNGEKIAAEINLFNEVNRAIAQQYGTHYINITESSRAAKNDVSLVAADGLHPSAEEYQKWAQLLAQKVMEILC